MLYDLHTHSYLSDGILSPEDLVSSAKLAGVTHLALTDHDSIAGLPRAKSAAQKENISIVDGIEISAQWSGKGIHIVGLNMNCHAKVLLDFIDQQTEARQSRAVLISQKLDKLGFEGSLAGARALAGNGTVGRPHFAKYLVEQGHASNVNQAFKRYLGNGKPGDVKSCWPEMETVVGLIQAAGGVAVLAHPLKYKLTLTKLRSLLSAFKEAEGHGVEVISGLQTPNETRTMVSLCNKFDLLASCGSDFHAPGQAWQALGAFGELPDHVAPIWSRF